MTAYQQLIAETASTLTPGDCVGSDDMPAFDPRQLAVIFNHDPCALASAMDADGGAVIDALDDKDRCYTALLGILRYHAARAVAADVQDALDAAAPAADIEDAAETETKLERAGAEVTLL